MATHSGSLEEVGLTASSITHYFSMMNDELKKRQLTGQICLCGGAVMCLEYKTRPSTSDVDMIASQPPTIIREIAAKIAKLHGLEEDWLNDYARACIALPIDPKDNIIFNESHLILKMSHLRIWAADAKFMLAMKVQSARPDGHDRDDIKYLIKHLRLNSYDEVADAHKWYYPEHRIEVNARYMIKEIIAGLDM